MSTISPPDLVSAVLASLDRLGPVRGARARVLGAHAAEWAERLAARGFRVGVGEESAEPADLVLAIDLLAHAEWDRWALQQAHAALAGDGRLLLAVPNALALGSTGHLLRLTSRLVQGRATNTRHDRRYRLSEVLATLDTLGFRVDEVSAHDFGWLHPVAQVAPGLVRGVADVHLVACSRLPSLFGTDPRRPWPDAAAHRRLHEERHSRFVEQRDRWRREHPRQHDAPIERFDPARHRGARVLVLAPHPDDEIIGCGGTLAKLGASGASVTVVHATDGSATAGLADAPPAVRKTVRLEEARTVGALMGFAALELWAEDDAGFSERDDLVERLRVILASRRPDLIFAPFVTDDHPAHRAVCRMLARALRVANLRDETRVLAYEGWNLLPATAYCDVTDVAGLHERALLRYATAMRAKDYVHACQDRNFYNACVLGDFRGFAEIFVGVAAREFPDLVLGDAP